MKSKILNLNAAKRADGLKSNEPVPHGEYSLRDFELSYNLQERIPFTSAGSWHFGKLLGGDKMWHWS